MLDLQDQFNWLKLTRRNTQIIHTRNKTEHCYRSCRLYKHRKIIQVITHTVISRDEMKQTESSKIKVPQVPAGVIPVRISL